LIELDRSMLRQHPRLAQHEFAMASLSLLMRSRPGDGIVLAEEEKAAAFSKAPPPALDPKFVWLD
jgi:hypothetical protein